MCKFKHHVSMNANKDYKLVKIYCYVCEKYGEEHCSESMPCRMKGYFLLRNNFHFLNQFFNVIIAGSIGRNRKDKFISGSTLIFLNDTFKYLH